jgi:hypothetical protein
MTMGISAADAPKAIIQGLTSKTSLWPITADAECPEITGNATYSAYLTVEPDTTVNFLTVDINGLRNIDYPSLTISDVKVRLDGADFDVSGYTVDYALTSGSFDGSRITLYNTWSSDVTAIPAHTVLQKSVEVIFTVSGMPTDGPAFVDKRVPQVQTTEATTQATEETTQPVVTGGSEQVVTTSSAPDTTETSTTVSTSTTTAATTVTNIIATTVNNGGFSGRNNTNTNNSGTAPLTGEKGVAIAFAGLALTACTAVASKIIKRKK